MSTNKFSRNTYNPSLQNNNIRGTFGTVVQDHTEPSNNRPRRLTVNIPKSSRSSSVPSRKKPKYSSNTLKQIDSIVTFFQQRPFRIKNTNNLLSIETNENYKFVPLSISNFKPRYNFTATNIFIRLFNKATRQFQWENCVAIFGGRSSETTCAQDQISKAELVVYGVNSKTWSIFNFITEEPKVRYAHATISHNGSLYVFGGTDGIHFNNDFLIISISGLTCACATISGVRRDSERWPSPRCSHSLTKFEIVKDEKKNNNDETFKAYLFGGIESSGELSGELWEVTCANGIVPTWRLVSQNGPPPRYGHIAFVKDGKFYVAGGYDQNGKPLNDIWMFDESKVEKRQSEFKKPQEQQQKRSRALLSDETNTENRISVTLGISPDVSHNIRLAKTANEYQSSFGCSDNKTVLKSEVKAGIQTSSSFNHFADQIESNEFEGHSSSFICGGWTQLAVFEPDPTVFDFDGKLFLIKDPDNAIDRITENKTLALLDDKFSQHFNFKSENEKDTKNEREKAVNSMYRSKLYEYQELERIKNDLSQPASEKKGIMDASNYFNPNKLNNLVTEIDKMRKEFLQKSLNIVQNHINEFCSEEKKTNNFTERFINEKMDELNTLTNLYQNRCSEVKLELDLSQKMLESLSGSSPVNIDDQGFKSSIIYAKSLIELDTKRQQILNLTQKIKRNQEKSGIKQQKMNEVMKSIAYAEQVFKQETDKRNKWDDFCTESVEQLQAADTIIESIKKGTSDGILKSKLNEVISSYNEVLEKSFGKERQSALKNIEGALKMIKNNIPFKDCRDNIRLFFATFTKTPLPPIVDSSVQHENAINFYASKTSFQQQPLISTVPPSQPDMPKTTVSPSYPGQPNTSISSNQQNQPRATTLPVQANQPNATIPSGQPKNTMPPNQPSQPNVTISSGQSGQPKTTMPPNQPGQHKATMPPVQAGQPKTTIPPNQPGQSKTTIPPNQPGQSKTTIQPNQPGQPKTTIPPNQPGQSKTTIPPNQPGQPKTTMSPNHPGQPNHMFPNQPGQPGHPGQSDQPNRMFPNQPGQPKATMPQSHPGQPSQVQQMQMTGQPGMPNRAMQPGQPGQPNRMFPNQPGQPGQPKTTIPQSHPGQTSQVQQMQMTGQPGMPNRAMQPGQPGHPSQPGQPGQPNRAFPNQPGQPGQPKPTMQPGQVQQMQMTGQPGQVQQMQMTGQPGQVQQMQMTGQPGMPNRAMQPGQPVQPNRMFPNQPGQPNRGQVQQMQGQPGMPNPQIRQNVTRHITAVPGRPQNLNIPGQNYQQHPTNPQQPGAPPQFPQQQHNFFQTQQQHQQQRQQQQQPPPQ